MELMNNNTYLKAVHSYADSIVFAMTYCYGTILTRNNRRNSERHKELNITDRQTRKLRKYITFFLINKIRPPRFYYFLLWVMTMKMYKPFEFSAL